MEREIPPTGSYRYIFQQSNMTRYLDIQLPKSHNKSVQLSQENPIDHGNWRLGFDMFDNFELNLTFHDICFEDFRLPVWASLPLQDPLTTNEY